MAQQTYTIPQALEMAVGHHQAGRLADAEAIYRRILEVQPRHPSALHNLAEIACRVRKYDAALDLARQAIAVEPENANNHNTLAVVLFGMGRADESMAACLRALELNPNFSNAHANLGICLADRGDLPASIAAFEKAIELDPNNPYAHDGLGLSLLMSGQLQRGWAEQEWRWDKYTFTPRRLTSERHWKGEDLSGKSIFLYVEQGYGDIIQFCRYVPLLAQRGAGVYLEQIAEMGGLLRKLPGLSGMAAEGAEKFDFVCPLMSVPLWFGTNLETIPGHTPYLEADPARAAAWREFFSSDKSFKIGIAWAGRPSHANDHNRSTTLASFAPLADVPQVAFYSLQKGQSVVVPEGMKLIDLSARLEDFDGTAAAIAQLDLVITVDTAVAHLAGALDKPVWNLLAFCPDWRWMLNRSDTPWYPSMRLFRAPARGDWAGLMRQVKEALLKRIGHDAGQN
jgi:tetratricopeptide (TPR) repeat protein